VQIINPLPIRLKESRERLAISQRELGVRIGIEQSVASSRMNHYEKGRHMPDFATLKRIAEELNVPVAYLFCETDELAQVVMGFEKLSREDKDKFVALLRQASPKSETE